MDDKRNRNVGADIHDMVKDAVSSMDFKKLNNEITISVNNALAEVRNALGIQADGDRLRGEARKPGTWRPAEPHNQQSNVYQMQDLKGQSNNQEQQNRQGLKGQPVSNGQPYQQGVPTKQRAYNDQARRDMQQVRHTNNMQNNTQVRHQGNIHPADNNRQIINNKQATIGKPSGTEWHNWNRQHNQAPNAHVSVQNQPGQPMRRGVRIPYVPKGRVLGTVATVLGSISTTGFAIAMLVFFILAVTIEADIFGTLFASFIFPLAASYMVFKAGKKLRARNARLNVYLKHLQYRGFCTIKELSSAIGESERFVLKDIKKMLSLGMFPEGYIDQNGTCVIATRENYEHYAIAQRGYEQRLHEENRRLVEEQERLLRQNHEYKNRYEKQIPLSDDPYNGLSPEVRETIISGREYIKLIKEANEAIEGEVISKKLDRLELVIDRILYHIEKHPDKISEIRRFMDYYLPTTHKLVMTYKDFDSQPLQGENIITAKEEIMKTMDTINFAFEKLLDSMFEDVAMDVSTDISVLETMLAQEGLTESDFIVNQD